MNLRWAVKIFGAFALVIALIIIPAAVYLGSSLKTSLIAQEEEDLKQDLNLAIWILADHIQSSQDDPAQLRQLTEQLGNQLGKRITLLSPRGRVIGDSVLSPSRIDQAVDLSNRPEILALQIKDYGRMIRFSPDLQTNTLFGAAPIRKNNLLLGYVRIALPLTRIEQTGNSLQRGLFLVGGLLVILAALISFLLSRHMGRPFWELTDMVQRMNEGDFKQPFHLLADSEIKELATGLETFSAGLSGKLDLLETETGELKTLLSSMREGVLVTDEKGRIILINSFLTEVLGEKASSKKRTVQEAFMSAELQDAVEAVLKGDPFQRLQFIFGRDYPRHFEVQVIALTSNHRPPRVVAIFHETTELRYLLKVRQDFVANASWELDKPLMSIKGHLDTLLPLIPKELPEVHQKLASILTEIKRLCLLVSDMLDLAKLDVQEKGSKNYERVEIKGMLTSIGEMVKEQAWLKNLSLDVDLNSLPEDLTAFWEKDRILQALYNVMDNAIKYTPVGGNIRLTAKLVQRSVRQSGIQQKIETDELRTPNSDFHRDFLEISVSDTGLGIPKEHLPRIFERFYRVDREYSRQLGGTGLGLAIVKHIIESHGGTVEVETQLGKGSTFTITLPLEPEWRSSNQT